MAPSPQDPQPLAGKHVAFVGKLGALAKRDATEVVREHGGESVDASDPRVDLVVVGADQLPLSDEAELLGDELQQHAADGSVEVISETDFWQRLGVIDQDAESAGLYTPAMLAELLDVPISIVRRWARRGLIVPAREVHKLPYFSFQEVATARNLAKMLAAGASPYLIEKRLSQLSRFLPDVERPLAQLSVIVEGRRFLLRQGEGLLEPGGQLRFDFESLEQASEEDPEDTAPATLQIADFPDEGEAPVRPDELKHLAMQQEDEGLLEDAAETYRAALAAGGPCAETNFALAELLYRIGDLSAARERYHMVLEIDEDFVEARHNLGCVLAEAGQLPLAAAAFEGALSVHPDYPDAHYHLARTLDDLLASHSAEQHWRAFLQLAPDSPWADEARDRLGKQPPQSPTAPR